MAAKHGGAAMMKSLLVLALAHTAQGFLSASSRRALVAPTRAARPPRERVRRCLALRAAAVLDGLEEVADRYDAFLIDQWGVMHDGTTAYPKAIECMAQLADRGKKIVLLSNSSRRKGNSMKKLDAMGFERCAQPVCSVAPPSACDQPAPRTAGRMRSPQTLKPPPLLIRNLTLLAAVAAAALLRGSLAAAPLSTSSRAAKWAGAGWQPPL